MSRVGKKVIHIPSSVTVTSDNGLFVVKGAKGELSQPFNEAFVAVKHSEPHEMYLELKRNSKEANALWGTYAALIRSMIKGVSEGYTKKLEIIGVGYKAEMKGNSLVLNLGYSHPIEMVVPEGISATVEKNFIILSSHDKERLGQFAANIRRHREPEPYKGKGIKYEKEIILRKEGKKSV
jgi:large subunit ribosomal protein L6